MADKEIGNDNLRPSWVKGGIVLAFSEKTALGSRSRLDEYGVARKVALPQTTRSGLLPSRARHRRFFDVFDDFVDVCGWLGVSHGKAILGPCQRHIHKLPFTLLVAIFELGGQ